MCNLVLESFRLFNGNTVELVDNGLSYEICVNGKVNAVEYDEARAYETFHEFLGV